MAFIELIQRIVDNIAWIGRTDSDFDLFRAILNIVQLVFDYFGNLIALGGT